MIVLIDFVKKVGYLKSFYWKILLETSDKKSAKIDCSLFRVVLKANSNSFIAYKINFLPTFYMQFFCPTFERSLTVGLRIGRLSKDSETVFSLLTDERSVIVNVSVDYAHNHSFFEFCNKNKILRESYKYLVIAIAGTFLT